MKIKYAFATETIEVEISEKDANIIVDLDRQEYNVNHKETRRHCSLDAFNLDDTLFPSDENVEAETETKDLYRRLYDAIALLEPQQKELVRQVFFNERKIVDIASEKGVSEAAIRNRLKKIIQRLKKILN